MSKSLDDIKAYSLSNDDINAILDPDTKVFTYPKFCQMKSIDEAFDSLGRCVFLFLTVNEMTGHWITMFKRDARTIEYWDSYGEKPEAQRAWLTPEKLEELGQSEKCLFELMKKSRYHVYYNTYPFQTDTNDINTCGRWCVARLICKDLSNLQFFNLVKASGMKPDDWVAQFTYDILGK